MTPAIKGTGTAGPTRGVPQAKAMGLAGAGAAPMSAIWEGVQGLSNGPVRMPAERGGGRSSSARSRH